jgi:poly(3-hydroxybutyrate) depolymerase
MSDRALFLSLGLTLGLFGCAGDAPPAASQFPAIAGNGGAGTFMSAAGMSFGGSGGAFSTQAGSGGFGTVGGAATAGFAGAGAGGVAGMAAAGTSAGGTGAGGMAGAAGMAGSTGNGQGLAKGIQTARPIGTLYDKRGFWEYLPKGYGDGIKRPLLVFEPGVGENGDGSADALNIIKDRHGPPNLIAQGDDKWPPDRPFVVLSPQHHDLGGNPEPVINEIYDFIAFAVNHYDVDPKRVYLTGLSSGATGCWIYLGAYPGVQVAAAALMSSDSIYAWERSPDACAVVNKVWVWDFHGEADQAIPIDKALVGIHNFQGCPSPSKPLQFTSYPNTDHGGTWDRTYDLTLNQGPNPDIYTWLLSKSL